MKALIIGNSPDFDHSTIEKLAAKSNLILVTDGAILKLPPGITPHIVCGDFDSLVLEQVQPKFPKTEFVQLPDQELNDLEKALLLAIERGATELFVVCIVGGAIDKSIANLSLLVRYHTRIPIRAYHGQMECQIVSAGSSQRITLESGQVVSTLPLSSPTTLSLSGVRYPLNREDLQIGSRGVGNQALGGEVCVEVFDGMVVMCVGAVF